MHESTVPMLEVTSRSRSCVRATGSIEIGTGAGSELIRSGTTWSLRVTVKPSLGVLAAGAGVGACTLVLALMHARTGVGSGSLLLTHRTVPTSVNEAGVGAEPSQADFSLVRHWCWC